MYSITSDPNKTSHPNTPSQNHPSTLPAPPISIQTQMNSNPNSQISAITTHHTPISPKIYQFSTAPETPTQKHKTSSKKPEESKHFPFSSRYEKIKSFSFSFFSLSL